MEKKRIRQKKKFFDESKVKEQETGFLIVLFQDEHSVSIIDVTLYVSRKSYRRISDLICSVKDKGKWFTAYILSEKGKDS